MDLEEEHDRSKMFFLFHPTSDTGYQYQQALQLGTLNLITWLRWCPASFSTEKFLFFLSVILEGESLSPHSKERELSSTSWREAYKDVWVRVGASFSLTEEEIQAVFSGEDGMKSVMKRAYAEGRFRMDGESYIPQPVVEDMNQRYGYTFDTIDYECNL